MTIQSNPRAKEPQQRRLDRACRYVDDLWFPVNGPLLLKIQKGLDEGVYVDPALLVEEIKSDFSLFSYCLRELLVLLKSDGAELPKTINPLEMLRNAGIDRLKTILKIDEAHVSTHRLQRMSDLQRARFEEALVSASTSESLSTAYEIDSELAFSSALLRQLGLTLICWNYPEVYERATQLLSQQGSLDAAISSILGFSPFLLAVRLLQRWGYSSELCEALGITVEADGQQSMALDTELVELAETHAIGETLSRLCRVGEALARANNPKLYPSARRDWEAAIETIEETLGSDGLDHIRTRFEENCSLYVTLCPQLFKGGLVLDPLAKIGEQKGSQLLMRNPHLENCRSFLKQKLNLLYVELRSEQISAKHIDQLTKEIMVSAGFRSGCVYTIDPGTHLLTPRLSVGEQTVSNYRAYAVDDPQNENEIVVLAYKSNTSQVAASSRSTELSPMVSIAGCLGFSQRLGAVQLELPRGMYSDDPAQHLIHFKALCQALNDCLGLN